MNKNLVSSPSLSSYGEFSLTVFTEATLSPDTYIVVVGNSSHLSAQFTIDANAPVQQPTAQGETVNIADVITLSQRLFLPVIMR